MGKVWRGTDEENGVAVDQTRDASNGDAVARGRTVNKMDLDVEVGGRFVKSGMGSLRDNPDTIFCQHSQIKADWGTPTSLAP